jgi:hypothetical protein
MPENTFVFKKRISVVSNYAGYAVTSILADIGAVK